jgi:hypothetical protein
VVWKFHRLPLGKPKDNVMKIWHHSLGTHEGIKANKLVNGQQKFGHRVAFAVTVRKLEENLHDIICTTR